MKLNRIAAALALMPFPAIAQQEYQVPAIEQYQGAPNPHGEHVSMVPLPPVKLTDKEREALRIAREWKAAPTKPRRSEDGSVKYLFGATLPTLVCAPIRVCAIQLQEGEIVHGVSVGDPRWKIDLSDVGTDDRKTVHAIVRPIESGLASNTIITTDRRVYTIALKSAKHEWMPSLSFDYPDDTERAVAKYRERQAKRAYATTMQTGENVAQLDFNYRLSGDSPKWKPQRVYNDGRKTYIQFPSSHFSDEAPALVALGNDGGLFSDPTEQLVNYRLIGDRFVVDQVIESAALISGVGRAQTKVMIEHEGEKQ